MDLIWLINIIPLFFKVGLFTCIFSLIHDSCVEKVEIVKEDKVKHALKINYALIIAYLSICIAIYTLMTFKVIILLLFSSGLVALFGVQNVRPDLLEFLAPINKNNYVKFVCKMLISVYKIIYSAYRPLIEIIRNNGTKIFSKLTNMGDSELIENMKNLYKSEQFANVSCKLSSLGDYLVSSKENTIVEEGNDIKEDVIEKINEINKTNEENKNEENKKNN